MTGEKIFVLAPHTDDGELGCGGTISKFCNEGKQVFYIAFSLCTKSLPPSWPPDTLAVEVKKATAILGIPPEQVILFDFDVRDFKRFRQQILEELILLRRKYEPDLVLVPSLTDLHQDHQVVAEEGLRAFKNTSMLGYEMPWNNITFNTRCFVTLDREHIQKKVRALREYESQSYRTYLSEEFIFSLAKTRGVQIQSEYAEAFDVIRWII